MFILGLYYQSYLQVIKKKNGDARFPYLKKYLASDFIIKKIFIKGRQLLFAWGEKNSANVCLENYTIQIENEIYNFEKKFTQILPLHRRQ